MCDGTDRELSRPRDLPERGAGGELLWRGSQLGHDPAGGVACHSAAGAAAGDHPVRPTELRQKAGLRHEDRGGPGRPRGPCHSRDGRGDRRYSRHGGQKASPHRLAPHHHPSLLSRWPGPARKRMRYPSGRDTLLWLGAHAYGARASRHRRGDDRLHRGLPRPAEGQGVEGGILSVFRRAHEGVASCGQGSVGIDELEAELVCAIKRVLFQVARARRGV